MEKNPLKMRMLKQLIIVILVMLVGGCSNAPTYPKKDIAKSLVDVCKKEFNVEIQVKLIDKNIIVFLPLPELFDQQMEILPEAIAKIEDVILITSRVIFSTDAEIEFYTLVTADVNVTAAELILVRYIDDLLKYMNGWMRRDDYQKRVLWRVTFNPEHLRSDEFNFDNLEKMSLHSFLAWQISQRINFSKSSVGLLDIKVEGGYSPGERQFAFSLIMANDEKFSSTYVPLILETAALVFSKYEFNDYASIKIINQLTMNSVVISGSEIKSLLMVSDEN